MNSFPMEVGRVVLSRAGRDQGHLFVIVDVIDENYVAIANGCQRKVDNPKKKKIKHLAAKPELLEEISKKISEKKRIFDSEVRNKLDAIGYQEALLPRKEG
jgi:ribosomal protein L14E/L6E/L27E